jgi:hypothetical protein
MSTQLTKLDTLMTKKGPTTNANLYEEVKKKLQSVYVQIQRTYTGDERSAKCGKKKHLRPFSYHRGNEEEI